MSGPRITDAAVEAHWYRVIRRAVIEELIEKAEARILSNQRSGDYDTQPVQAARWLRAELEGDDRG